MNWISVKDRLPGENGDYLCFYTIGRTEYQEVIGFAKCLEKFDELDFAGENGPGFYDYDSEFGYFKKDDVTHWMPLPEPPHKGEEMTNYERIKNMTVEEMSEFLNNTGACCDHCTAYINNKPCSSYLFCKEGIKEYLESEVEE